VVVHTARHWAEGGPGAPTWRTKWCGCVNGAAVLGHSGTPAQFMFDALAQHVGRAHLTVHHIHPVGRMPHAAQPGQGLVGVGVGRGRGELHHFGAHIHILPVDAGGLFAAGNARAARARGPGSR
jgi:hypothetical protein